MEAQCAVGPSWSGRPENPTNPRVVEIEIDVRLSQQEKQKIGESKCKHWKNLLANLFLGKSRGLKFDGMLIYLIDARNKEKQRLGVF